MRRAARSPWEVFAVRCLMGSSGLFVAAWLRIVVVSEDIPWVHLWCIIWFLWVFHLYAHTHILTNRFSGLERGMSPDLWWLTRCFRCILQILRGMEWLVMIGHPSESETRSQGAELDLLAWLCQELSGCKSVGFQHWGDDPNWAKVRHYRETQEDEGLPGCTSAWFATATESTNGEERNIELYRCVHCRCLDTLDVRMYDVWYVCIHWFVI